MVQSRVSSNVKWWLMGSAALLTVSVFAFYWHTLDYGYTELDDSIFLRERETFNQDPHNIWRAFTRGVFVDSGDTYYRPFLLWTFIADRHREGRTRARLHVEDAPTDRLTVYRLTNIVLHCAATVLVFALFISVGFRHHLALLLGLVFAVHPTLVQAVVWIPGRNDTMLGIATFTYAILLIHWFKKHRWWNLSMQAIVLLAALLTKETAVIVGPAVLSTLALWLGKQALRAGLLLPPLGVWVGSVAIWYLLRSQATVEPLPLDPAELLAILLYRLPLYIHYVGKSLLPVGLSVFPRMEDTSIVPGLVVIVLLAVLIWRGKTGRGWVGILAATAWYVLFLLPALVVPRHINQEAFEHRLYVPLIGILWLVGQTVERYRYTIVSSAGVMLVAVFASIAWQRTESFRNRIVFWEEAVSTSPHSSYARMMLGARYYLDKLNPRKVEGEKLLWEAYMMDSNQKYINYYIGNLYWDRNDLRNAKRHYLRELELISTWGELYFRLARIMFEEGKLDSARILLERQLVYTPDDPQANHNLLLLYLDTGMPEKAQSQIARMRKLGLPIPPGAERRNQ